ncbi:anthranilate synthase component I [Thalassoglobus polymorphus]|uniref:Anthranilate synthase component 1 n=1 Tax=Thalassoglobus polymorphus TaxID=2527994 RepID=A0A517QQ15_9PLAN|nr:anthranilate synthase component I [Thalassoglobus polymorphus]QDT33721.1 Anthranilate synthase component 1 [Thalassoglobus polymorphus]
MHYHPSFEQLVERVGKAGFIPVYRKLYSDTLTPVTAFCKANWSGQSFLFESVVGGEKVGRYSFLGGDPFLRIDAYGNEVEITRDGQTEKKTVDDPLITLGDWIDQFSSAPHPNLPRFVGGAVGYAGYDVVRYTENLPNPPEDDRKLPDYSFAFYDSMIIFDHIEKTTLVVAQVPTDTGDLRAEYDRACSQVDDLCARLQSPQRILSLTDVSPDPPMSQSWKSNFSQEEYEEAVESCKEYIKAGDIFQVVISQRLEVETTATPLEIYRALRVVNPSPFMFLLQTPGATLVGSSPEIMVRVEDGETTIRPLAGTRKRGETEEEDRALAEELVSDPKERAEHVMLVDLARNDVGRIAKYNSVTLSDVMVVEKYSHVMHITSNVKGQLREGLTCLDALRAGLPAGTVSGAPKVRAMEIIDELEKHRRGPYAGAVGYIDYTGDMDTCIALRTMVMIGNKAYVQAGAGIVADSVPSEEYHETLNKAKGLLKAIAVAEASK